jgi:pimeloyl-ACP methyl ester carboxylesterase
MAKAFLKFILLGFALCLALILLLALVPWHGHFTAPLTPAPPSYKETRAALEQMFADVPQTLSLAGHPRAYLHDQPTDQVFVLLHGLTSAPEQFDLLARQLYARGHNVVITLSPGHGEADVMTDKLASVTAQQMLDAANRSLNLAHGLGHHVTLVGLSVNGTTAAWFAQHRPDLSHAVLLAPLFAPQALPDWALAPASRLAARLPNKFIWWNSKLRELLERPAYSYPRFASRNSAEMLLLGLDVLDSAKKDPPACHSIVVVTTASDAAVDNAVTDQLVSLWRASKKNGVTAYKFPAEDKIPHDFIDPNQADQRISIVYPKMITLLETEQKN